MNALLIPQFFNINLEFLLLAAVLIILSKMIFDSFQDKNFSKGIDFRRRIPPQKASLYGQQVLRVPRASKQAVNSITFGF